MYSATQRSHKKGAVFNLTKSKRQRGTREEEEADEDDGDFQDTSRHELRRPPPAKRSVIVEKSRRESPPLHEANDLDFQLPFRKRPPMWSRQTLLDNHITTPETRRYATTLIMPRKRGRSPPLILPHKATRPQQETRVRKEASRDDTPPRLSLTRPKSATAEPAESGELVMPQRRSQCRYQPSHTAGPMIPFSQDSDVRQGEMTCPYCREVLVPPFSKRLQQALAHALEQCHNKDAPTQENEPESTRIRAFVRPQMKSKRPRVPHQEQDAFCRMHNVELVVKRQGEANGFPTDIDFDSLHGRILHIQGQLEQVVSGKLPSTYRDVALQAYDHMGKNRARSTMSVLARFETSLPGYYGAKGAAVILESLTKIFLHSGKLTIEHTRPQLPLEYLQQVLVPETGYRLIREDLTRRQKKSHQPTLTSFLGLTDQAKKLMKESSEYGNLVYPDTDEIDDARYQDLQEISSDDSDNHDSPPDLVDLTDDS